MPQYWMDSTFCGFHDESLEDDWKVFTEPALTSSEEDSSDMDGTCHTGSPLNLKAKKVGFDLKIFVVQIHSDITWSIRDMMHSYMIC